MTLLDYVKKGDYSEVLPYLQTCRRSKRIIRALSELTNLVSWGEKKNSALENLMKEMDGQLEYDLDWQVPESPKFNGSPRSEEGRAWIKALTERFHNIIDSRSIGMLHDAINLDWYSRVEDYNPKTYLRNYNRYIANEITSNIDMYERTDYVIFLTTSSEYALDENDIKQIKSYFAQASKNSQVAIHLCTNEDLEDEMWIEWCECGRDSAYMSSYDNYDIERGMEGFFSQQPKSTMLSRNDFDRIQKEHDVLCMVEAITQNGAEELAQTLKRFIDKDIPHNTPTIAFCIDFPMEADACYSKVMSIMHTINELYHGANIVWGTRINESLPANGCSIFLLAAIPDDFFRQHMGYDEA